MAGLLWGEDPTRKPFMRHITSDYMAKHVFEPFLTCPCTFMAQWGSKKDCYGGLVMGRGPSQETVLCAISHLITWHNMYLGHF